MSALAVLAETVIVRVGDVAEQIRGVSYSKADVRTAPQPGYVPLLRGGNVHEHSLVFDDLQFVPDKCVSQKQILQAGDIVVVASSGSLSGVGKAASVPAEFHGTFGAFCKVIRPTDKIDASYLGHYFRTAEYRSKVSSMAGGANINNLRNEHLDGLKIRLPALREQRRIAAILDKADEVRAKRRQALAQLEGLAESIFENMFGDLGNWNAVSLHELCHGDLRNGVSPSTRGTVTQQVLTLSAVTGTAFEAGAVKSGLFDRPTPVAQRVSSTSLLICRGNGNINLVGRGHFPPVDNEGVVFPDTVIAAKPSLARVTRGYLGHLWNTPFIRRQISSRARTTNGTYKVNQAALGQVQIPEPPMPMQQDFSEKLESVDRLRKNYRAQAAQIDALFACLQHRAFRGQL
jgi:type I restriction enzyme S subunit